MKRSEILLELINVDVIREEKQILDHICFDVRAGEIHAVAGTNGSGKSALAGVICGEVRMDSGMMIYDGRPVRFSGKEEAARSGICFAKTRRDIRLKPTAKIFILDEPTAHLSAGEIIKLHDYLPRLKEWGVGVIYISHRLDDLLNVSDRISVIRKGECIETLQTAQTFKEEIMTLML